MNANIPDPLIDKIAKLLRLSASPHQGEAELALAKAKQLAVENDIDLASVSTDTNQKDTYAQDTIRFGGRTPVTGNFVFWIIGSHFNTHIVHTGSRNMGKQVNFIGKTKDVQISIYVFHFLSQTFMALWHQYKNNTGCSARSRGSYFYGLYQGLDQKLTEAKERAEANKFSQLAQEKGASASADVKNSYALMVISNKEKLQEALEEFYPKLRKGGSVRITIRNDDALTQGVRDGRNIEIKPAIGMKQASALVGA